MEILICDIEANGLYDDVTEIHCIGIKKKGEDNVDMYFSNSISSDNCNGTIEQAIDRLATADLIIGHNFIDYDVRVIQKLYPNNNIDVNKIRDTMIRSYLFNPHRAKHIDCPVSKETINGRKPIGAHSLENFGYLVGRGKVEHEDWTSLTEDMIHRCVEDVHITDLADDYLEREASDWDWSKAEKIENSFRYILSEQEGYGVLVDRDHIDYCIEQLEANVNRIDSIVLPNVPKTIKCYDSITKGVKLDGTATAVALRWYDDIDVELVGDFCKVEFNTINLDSDKQVKEYLLSIGWQPTEWNFKKDGKELVRDEEGNPIRLSPKLTEDSLSNVKGSIGKLISERITSRHRLSQIQGLKERVRPDGRLSAGGNSIGTNTGRVTHRNVVNIPKASDDVFFGKEMRAIFTVPEGYKLVGADLSSLENRIAAHYTSAFDGGEFAHRALKGDPHQYIADMLSISRDHAKGINYGIMYGAGVNKIKDMLDCGMNEARHRYAQWWDANPALQVLKDRIAKALQRHPGFIRGIDGRKIFVRSEHSAMNALFQNAGSLVNKIATILIYKEMKANNIDGHMVINYHDEVQAEINEKDVDKYSELVLQCYKRAGEYFCLNVPIEGEVKYGNNWAETH